MQGIMQLPRWYFLLFQGNFRALIGAPGEQDFEVWYPGIDNRLMGGMVLGTDLGHNDTILAI